MISANDLRKKQGEKTVRGETLKDLIKRQNKAILEASDRGQNSTVFLAHKNIYDVFEDEMVDYYHDLGYKFKPVGVIGGVMQDSVDICW